IPSCISPTSTGPTSARPNSMPHLSGIAPANAASGAPASNCATIAHSNPENPMLGQRVVTAVVLLAVLAAALAAGNPGWFTALLAVAAACACWEWLRLTVVQPPSRALCTGVAAAMLAFMLWLAWAWLSGQPVGAQWRAAIVRWLVPGVAAIWLLAVGPAVVRGRADKPAASLGWSLFSVPAVLAAWSAL